MESVERILTSPNAPIVLIFLTFVVVIGWIAAKTGLLNIHTDNIRMGVEDRERAIIRCQTEWIKNHLEGLERSMKKPKDYDEWRGKYVIEVVYDEYVKMIAYNHITTDPQYVEVKSDTIVSIIHKLTEKPEFQGKAFENVIREDTKANIAKLVQIRELYK